MKLTSMEGEEFSVKQTANNLTDAIVTYLNLQGHFVWRQNNGGVYDPKKKVFRKNPNHKKGVPDVCGVHKQGYALFVEVKAKGDRLSDEQKQFGVKASMRGAIWIMAHSLDDVINYPL